MDRWMWRLSNEADEAGVMASTALDRAQVCLGAARCHSQRGLLFLMRVVEAPGGVIVLGLGFGKESEYHLSSTVSVHAMHVTRRLDVSDRCA